MADGPDSQSCLDIKAVFAGRDDLGSVHSCSGSLFHDVFAQLAPKVAKVESIRQDGSPDSGTSFFVKDGTHVVTNNHVVQQAAQLHINYQGKDYEAVVEKIDDANDLAELKVIGLDADPSRAQKVGATRLSAYENVIGVGVPGVHNQEKYINPGVLRSSDTLLNILSNPAINDPDAQKIQAGMASSDPVLRQQASERANATRLIVNQGGRPGESGTPVTDADNNLVGVLTSTIGNNVGLVVPYTKVQALIDSPESKYNFNYQVKSNFTMPNFGAALEDTGGAGVAAAGFLGKGRFLPAAYGAVRGANMLHEINELTKTTDDNQKGELKTEIAQDATMLAGGVAATAFWSNPIGRYVGLGAMGLSLASRLYTDSQEKHYVLQSITRKDGDPHRPWSD